MTATERAPIKWRATVGTPEIMQAFIQEIQGVAGIIKIEEQGIVVEFESNDEYELGQTVMELEHTLAAVTGENINVTRPKAQ